MKAVQMLGHEPAAMALTDVGEPLPAPDEVLVQVDAVSASRLDLGGRFPVALGRPVAFPHIVGGDPSGVVVEVGEEVDRARLGERVVVKPNLFCGRCTACAEGHEADCTDQPVLGVHRDGGAAELVAVPSRSAFRVPDEVELGTATAAVHTVPVALHMVRVAGGVPDGSPVLVSGAAGAVGSAALQVVAALGGRPIAVVQDAGQADWVRRLEPADVVDLEHESLAAGLTRCAPDGVALAVDTTGVPDLFSAMIDGLGRGGHIVTVAGGPEPRVTLDLSALYRHRRTIHGSAASDVRDVVDALELVRQGRVVPQVGLTLPLADHEAAYAALADQTRAGKIVMRVSA